MVLETQRIGRLIPRVFPQSRPFALDAGAGMLFDGSEPTLLGQRGVALLRLLLERAPDRLSARTR